MIDDDVFIRDMARTALSKRGFGIEDAASGAEALARLDAPPPDLVILDLELPDLSGLEVLKRMNTARGWKDVRVLMLSADHKLDSVINARAAGAVGYLCKPIEPSSLDRMVGAFASDRRLTWVDDYSRFHSAETRPES